MNKPQKVFSASRAVTKTALLLCDEPGVDIRVLNKNSVVSHGSPVIHQADQNSVIRLFKDRDDINFALGLNEKTFARDLSLALRTSEQQGDIRVEDLIGEFKEVREECVSDYSQKDRYLNQIMHLASSANAFANFPKFISIAAWELMMNAVFDSILASDEAALQLNQDRSENIIFSDEDRVTLRYGYNDMYFAVSVKDRYGSLDKAAVIKSLARCLSAEDTQKINLDASAGSAGIGLYLALSCLNQIYFIVNRNVSTEVIGIVNLTKRQKEFQSTSKTIRFIIKEGDL